MGRLLLILRVVDTSVLMALVGMTKQVKSGVPCELGGLTREGSMVYSRLQLLAYQAWDPFCFYSTILWAGSFCKTDFLRAMKIRKLRKSW